MNDGVALRMTAKALSAGEQSGESVRAWQAVLLFCPGDREAAFNVARAWHAAGELGAAEWLYRAAMAAGSEGAAYPDDVVAMWLGRLLVQVDRPAEAVRLMRPWARSTPRLAKHYASAVARCLPSRLAGALEQESLSSRADPSLDWFDGVPSDDLSIRVFAARPDTRSEALAYQSGLDGEREDFLRPPYSRPPLYVGCYREATILAGGVLLTSEGRIVSESVYAHGFNPPVGPATIFHRKSWLRVADDGTLRYSGPPPKIRHCPFPVLNLVTSRMSYGAFLTTQLTRLLARAWIDVPDLRIAMRPLVDFDAGPLLEPLGIPADRVVELAPGEALFCDAVFSSNYPVYEYQWILPEAIGPLRQIRDGLAPSPERRRRLYVTRKDTRTRYLANEDEVVAALKPYGFEFVVPSQMSWEDKVRAYADAEIVVGPNGSGLYNALFARNPDCHVVGLFDGFDGPSTLFVVTELAGIRLSAVRATGAWSSESLGGRRTDAYEIDPQEVVAAVRHAIADLQPAPAA